MSYTRKKYYGIVCPVSKTEPGQAMSVSEIIRRTLRGEAVNLNTNYYFEEKIQPTDRLDVDIIDVSNVRETLREQIKMNANSKTQHSNSDNKETQVSNNQQNANKVD